MHKTHIGARIVPLVLLCALVFTSFCGCAGAQAMADAIASDIDAYLASKTQSQEAPSQDTSAQEQVVYPQGPYADLYDDDVHLCVDFRDMEYQRPDMDRLAYEISQLTVVAESGDKDAVIAQCDLVDELWSEAVTQYRIADIHYNIDINDTFYEEEQEYVYEALTDLEVELYDQYLFLIENGYEDVLREDWGEDELQDVIEYAALTTPESAALDARDNELQQEYYDVIETTTIFMDGREWTWDQIMEDDKITGDTYQRYIDAFCNQLAENIGDEFMEMVSIRNEQAQMLGYESYAHYRNAVYDRDYSPEDVAVFREAVKAYIVPLYYDMILRSYGYDDKQALFDMTVEEDAMMDWARAGLGEISPDLVQAFDYMREYHLYHIEDSEGKIGGAYTTYIDGYESPFYLGAFTGDYYAVNELVHEFGHYASYFHNPGDGPLDLAEIDSQGLQLLMIREFDEIYGEDVAGDAAADVLLDMMYSLITGCLYDELQEKIYTENLSMDEIGALHAQLYEDYGLADLYYYSEHSWILVSHNFTSPYYYISYATSAVPALEIWQTCREDWDVGVSMYLSLYERDHYDGFTQVLEDLGFSDPLDPETIEELALELETGMDAYLTQPWDEVMPDAA